MVHAETSDESEDTSIPQVYFKFMVLEEHGTLLELRYTSEGEFQDEHKWHISNLAQHLTQEMARNFAEGDWFVLFSEHIDIVSSEVHASLLKHLMAAIPAEKFLFVHCPMYNFGSPLETLIRHCRHYQIKATAAGQIHLNLEIHAV